MKAVVSLGLVLFVWQREKLSMSVCSWEKNPLTSKYGKQGEDKRVYKLINISHWLFLNMTAELNPAFYVTCFYVTFYVSLLVKCGSL